MTMMECNLISALQQTEGDRLALSSSQQSISYAELIKAVTAVSTWLAESGVRSLALAADNSVDWVIVDLACQQAGIVCVPLPSFFSSIQILHCLVDCNADVVISDKPDFDQVIPGRSRRISLPLSDRLHCWRTTFFKNGSVANEKIYSNNGPVSSNSQRVKAHVKGKNCEALKQGKFPRETQKITFTSGSTGSPKGVCLSLSHQLQVACSLAEKICLNHPEHLCLLPLSTLLENIAGIYGSLLRGGTVVIPSDEERGMEGSSKLNVQALLGCIERSRPASMILLPQLLSVLVASCQMGWRPPSSLRFVAVGGARVSPYLLSRAADFGLPVYQGYGLSECGSVVALNTPDKASIDAVGTVLPSAQVKIENGEIIVEGSNFLGYLGQPESWYPQRVNTGDRGSLEDGFLRVNGRSKNVVISSFGRNISPEWVETEMLSKPLVSQCLVLGDDQPHLAALLSAPDKISDDMIDHWVSTVNDRLPDYAQVKKWRRLPENAWEGLNTANGRIRRNLAANKFEKPIARLWQ